jgi:oligopeptide transport system permease protein
MLARLTRTAVLEVLSQDYIRTAHGKGLPTHTVLTVHVLRNASIPLMTYVGPIFLELVAGSLVIESMFGFPGMGREYWEAVIYRDYTMIMAITLLDGVFLVLANMGVDFLYTVLDPRIRIG